MFLKDYIGKKISFPNANITVKPIKRLNHSNNSQVYLTTDEQNSKYILKILTADPEDKLVSSSINSEIILLSYLKLHPNIVTIIDHFFQETSTECSYYILLENCSNGSLSDLMTRVSEQKNCFSDNQIWKILNDVTKALKGIHSLRYIHRNLSPRNILINSEGTYKLCDFAKSTNKIYDTINNSNRNEIILDISKFTTPSIRAPEQIDLFSGNVISEKVDMWALGLLLYNLLFDAQFCDSNKIVQMKKEYFLNDEMINNTNPAFIQLIEMLLKMNPKSRISADDLLVFIDKNWEKNEEVCVIKRRFSLINKISETTAKIFKRHSTQFWVLKLTDPDLASPKIKYMKLLLNKAWTKREKVIKFYENISKLSINYFSTVALKTLLCINYYILYGPPEVVTVEFNTEEFLISLSNLWKQRFETNTYDEDDLLKNSNISKFVCSYTEYIIKKIKFHKNYSFFHNNFSLENLSANKHFNHNLLIDRNFIKDLFTLYNYLYQLYSKVPIIVVFASGILDQIIQVISDELNFLFILLLYIIVIFKHHIFLHNEEISKEYDSCFVELVNKVNDQSEKYKKFRFEIKSKLNLILLPNNLKEYLKFLNQILIKGSGNLKQFSIKNFLTYTKEINGIKMHPSYGKINDDINKSLMNGNNLLPNFEEFIAIREQINRHFEFSQFEKFNFFRFNDNYDKYDEKYDNNIILETNKKTNGNNVTKYKNSNLMSNIQAGDNQFPNYLFGLYHSNNIQSEKVSNNNNFEATLNHSNKYRKKSTDHLNKNNGIPDFNSVLNEIFESSSKNSMKKTDSVKKDKKNPNEIVNTESNEIQMPKYDSEKFKNILLEMDKLYKNIEVDDYEKEHSTKNNLHDSKSVNFKPNNEINLESIVNQSFDSKASNSKSIIEHIKNEGKNNIEETNNINVHKISMNPIIDKEMFNYIKNAEIKESKNINEKLPRQSLSSHKSEVSNINIYNIHNNINTIRVEENTDLEKIANSFLYQELSKTSLHWLISSKDIEIEKKIGYGGSSEVFQANYRGTDVAVKKLRILDVKEENLKEFKREVSSLIMLRHPNLVLFMGAIAEKDNICIVTEYCAGGTLFSILHQRKDLIITWELRLKILLEIAVGINFLHTNNPPIMHRDLKSLNILLTEKIEKPSDNTKIKISDFGLSKIFKNFDSRGDKLTGQLGTCHWMAPEIIDNKEYTLKADIYSYGIIIWEICARRTPYSDMNQQQISYFVSIKKGRPDQSLLPPNTPKQLLKLMELCWDEDPNIRPSFSQIIQYLKKITI